MTNDMIKTWFLDKLNSCYIVDNYEYQKLSKRYYIPKIKNAKFYFYDKITIRRMKLCEINNTKFELNNKINGQCLFIKDSDRKILYCELEKIWTFLEDNYYFNNNKNSKNNYTQIAHFISEILNNQGDFKDYDVTWF